MDKHGLVRGLIIPEIVKIIAREFDWDDDKALDAFYTSETGRALADDDSGLYGQSPLYITGIFMMEMKARANNS